MKARIFLPLVFLAVLFVVPQAQAQDMSRRQERKLKREMKKLEKQMKKVHELKTFNFDFNFDGDDFLDARIHKEFAEQQKVSALKHRKMAMKQKEMAMRQADRARVMARRYQRENLERVREYQHRSTDQARRVFELQREQLEKIREHYPDGFEIPEIVFEMPDMDFDFPEIAISVPHVAEVYKNLVMAFESDNNLSINKTLSDESVEKEHKYTVAEDAIYLDLRVKGSVESGEVKITLKTPDDKEYQTIELNSSADINWNQKMKLEGDNKDKYKGKWTISVKGDKVKGRYSIYMRSR